MPDTYKRFASTVAGANKHTDADGLPPAGIDPDADCYLIATLDNGGILYAYPNGLLHIHWADPDHHHPDGDRAGSDPAGDRDPA